eukprot:GFYU01005781.1.p1 GENE.GFYU01005781.1~~GFYU01005781.1.p1  ORF type:complete len:323 (-),score=79.76 GFYU01005781.1:192-1160(-)
MKPAEAWDWWALLGHQRGVHWDDTNAPTGWTVPSKSKLKMFDGDDDETIDNNGVAAGQKMSTRDVGNDSDGESSTSSTSSASSSESTSVTSSTSTATDMVTTDRSEPEVDIEATARLLRAALAIQRGESIDATLETQPPTDAGASAAINEVHNEDVMIEVKSPRAFIHRLTPRSPSIVPLDEETPSRPHSVMSIDINLSEGGDSPEPFLPADTVTTPVTLDEFKVMPAFEETTSPAVVPSFNDEDQDDSMFEVPDPEHYNDDTTDGLLPSDDEFGDESALLDDLINPLPVVMGVEELVEDSEYSAMEGIGMPHSGAHDSTAS